MLKPVQWIHKFFVFDKGENIKSALLQMWVKWVGYLNTISLPIKRPGCLVVHCDYYGFGYMELNKKALYKKIIEVNWIC